VGTYGASLQIVLDVAVLLPESFRGGCSVGVGATIHPDLFRVIELDALSL
jgi:hypothetical protein